MFQEKGKKVKMQVRKTREKTDNSETGKSICTFHIQENIYNLHTIWYVFICLHLKKVVPFVFVFKEGYCIHVKKGFILNICILLCLFLFGS